MTQDHEARDLISTLEVDVAAIAPQTVYGIGSEVAYNKTPLEVNPWYSEKAAVPATKDVASKAKVSRGLSKKRIKTVISFGILLAVIAVSVGVGVGVGTRRSKSATRAAATSSIIGPTSTLISSSTTTSTLPQQTTRATSDHRVLNNTALASIATSNETSRHVFFQERSGIIRESIYAGGQWTAPTNYIIDTGRNSTPLTAVYIPAPREGIADQLFLFYVSTNNTLMSQLLSQSQWSPIDIVSSNLSSPIRVQSNTRSLSAVYIPSPNNPAIYSIYLTYEDAVGGATLLHCTINRNNNFWSPPQWSAMSLQSRLKAATQGALLVGPYGAIRNYDPNPTTQDSDVEIFSMTLSGSNYSSLVFGCVNGSFSQQQSDSTPFGDKSIMDSDLGVTYIYRFYIGNATLKDLGGSSIPSLLSPFPYTRLAAISPGPDLGDGYAASGPILSESKFWLYHQVNDTTFAEDAFDGSTGHFTSSNFTVEIN